MRQLSRRPESFSFTDFPGTDGDLIRGTAGSDMATFSSFSSVFELFQRF